MTSEQKPLEYWISFDDPHQAGFAHLENPGYDDLIHVIEYDAYLQLAKENAQLKEALKLKRKDHGDGR